MQSEEKDKLELRSMTSISCLLFFNLYIKHAIREIEYKDGVTNIK